MTATTPQDGRLILDPQRLKRHRQQLGLSQEALAQHCFDQRLCVSIASIKRAERGRPVLYRTARHLATAYEVDVESLLPASSPPEAQAPLWEDDPADEPSPRSVVLLVGQAPADDVAAWDAMVQHFGGAPQPRRQDARYAAIFGTPRAYRSDALRCLRCAQSLFERALESGRSPPRLGILSRQWPLDERLAGAEAPPATDGEAPLLVERGIAIQLAEHFIFEEDAGGWLRPVGHAEGVAGPGHDLVGRHVEINQLRSILDTTSAYQSGHIVYVRGVAGIGKTRLSHEFGDMAQECRMDRHRASVLDFGTRSDDGPLAQLLRSLLDLVGDGAALEPQLRARLHGLGLREEHAMALRPLLGLPQHEEHGRLYAAMTAEARGRRLLAAFGELILRRAIARPQVLIVEDLHWADEALLATLAGLLRETWEAPVIWLLTSRLEQDPLETRLRPLLAELPLSLIELAPLRTDEAQALAARFTNVASAHAAQCVAKAQGNPLFLTQLLLFHPHRTLPASLKNLVQSKLDQLTVQDCQAMRLAATMGQRFSLTALRALLGQDGYRPLLPQSQNLVRPLGTDDYQFVHALILQGIYEGIPKVQRDRLHLRLADHYADRDVVLRAQHLHKARSLAAPAAFLQAIETQLARHQHAEALTLLRQCQAIDYAQHDDYRLHSLHAKACMAMGLMQEAHRHYELARQAAGDDGQHIHASIGLARVLNMLDELDREERELDDVHPLAEAEGDHAALADICYLKGNIDFPRGNYAQSRRYHGKALEHARLSGETRTEIQALSGLGDAHYAEGRMLSTLRNFAHCVALCRRHGHPDLEAANLFMLGTARIYTNETGKALDDCLNAADLGRRVGNRRAEIVARLTAGWILLSRAAHEAAAREIDTALEIARTMGANRFEAFLLESQARAELIAGEPEKARNTIRTAWHLVQRFSLYRFIGPWVLGTLALLEEHDDERRRALERGSALLDEGCVGHNWYRFLVAAAEACLLHGDADGARRHARRLAGYATEEPCPWATHHVTLIEHHADWLEAPTERAFARAFQHWQEGRAAGLAMTMPRLAMESYGQPATGSAA